MFALQSKLEILILKLTPLTHHTHTDTQSAWTRFIPTLHILASVCVLQCIVVFSHTSLFDVSFVTVNKRRLMNGRWTAAPSEGGRATAGGSYRGNGWPLLDKMWTAQKTPLLQTWTNKLIFIVLLFIVYADIYRGFCHNDENNCSQCWSEWNGSCYVSIKLKLKHWWKML